MEVLSEKGLKGATASRIAARAGLSPGAIYRRFPDKDALLRSVFIEVLEKNDKGISLVLDSQSTKDMDLKSFAEWAVRVSVEGQRRYSGLFRALNQYLLGRADARFKRKAAELQVKSFRRVVDFLTQRSKEINHPDPATALPFGLMIVGFTMSELIIRNELSEAWAPLLPKDDRQLERELTRAMLAYLGADYD